MRVFSLIITFLFLTACSDNILADDTETYPFELNTGLEQDSNGFYRLPMNQYGDGTQTIHQFSVDTNNPNTNPPQFVHWDSDTQIQQHLFGDIYEDVDIINHSSYANSDGIAYTMFGPHSDQIGDTVLVYVAYQCNTYDVEYEIYFGIILDSPNQ